MKILIVPDVDFWALHRLSMAITQNNPHIEFEYFYWAPRELEQRQKEFRDILLKFNPDLVHFQYFRTCDYALQNVPELSKFRKILTHHNQKNLLSGDWKDLDLIVCHTEKAAGILRKDGYENVTVIQHGINLDYWKFNDNWPQEKIGLGYVGRIVPWKGFKELVKFCKETKNRFIAMVGDRIEKPNYVKEIHDEVGVPEDYGECVFGTPDEDRQKIYNQMTFYIGNSRDGREEGPLGLLEAMASGVPVITTKAGEAADIIEDGKNGMIMKFEDYDDLKSQIQKAIKKLETDDGRAKLEKMRQNAWNTVKNMSEEKMAYMYQLVYNRIVFEDQPFVSIITPTYNRLENIKKILKKLDCQDYQNFEIVICDDNSDDGTEEWVKKNRFKYSFCIKYINTEKDGYNLALARNMGVIEAVGEFLVFCDSRLVPKEFGIMKLIEPLLDGEKLWSYGKKGDSDKRSFVENFSAIRREQFIDFGMFNERIDQYGGMSQEIRTRWQRQGGIFTYCEDAKAEILSRAEKKNTRRNDIIKMKFRLLKLGL